MGWWKRLGDEETGGETESTDWGGRLQKEKRYDAFISYKHDPYVSRIAHTVLRRLERYRPPKGSGAQKKKLYLCIDDQNLAAAGILNKQIYEALANSEYLIYLACPETLGSKYCLDEIRYFKKLHDGRLDNIIVLLIKGEPKDVFPQELCYEGCWEENELPDPERKTEVHWLDLKAENFREAAEKLNDSLLMIASPLFHCDPDELIQRDRQWKKQKRMMWGMLGVTASAVVLCVAYTFWLTWSVDYKRQAENALADGNDNKALFYYAKALSLNPFDEEARINSQLLIQKEAWPMVVKEDEDSVILGNHVYPLDISSEKEECLLPVCITTEGGYTLWEDGKEHYYVSDADGIFFEELSDEGSFFYYTGQTVSNAWCLVNNQEQYYTFYWPEEKRIEKLVWKENFSGRWEKAGVYALQPGMVAVMDHEALTFGRLEGGVCQELCRIELSEIFREDQVVSEEYNMSLLENYICKIWTSPDGSRLVITAEYWYNSGRESFCHSKAVLFDTETFSMVVLAENGECLISNVVFQDDSQKLALIYNNKDGILENRGGAAVYDCFGDLIFEVECGSDLVPWNGYFCGKLFLLCDLSATYFLDAETGEQICNPLLLHVNQAALTDDGQIALEHQFGVRYCQMVRYSEGTAEINIEDEDIANAFRSEMEMKYQLEDDLWLRASDDRKEILLADGNGKILDRFLIQEEETENGVIALAYGISTHTAFALDEARNLHCILIELEEKKFVSKEKEHTVSGVVEFAPAPNGVVYLNGYLLGSYSSVGLSLMYTKNDHFLFFHDPVVQHFGWFAEPNIKDSFADLIVGESDYAVIVTQKEGQINFRFFSMKTGDFLADMSHEAAEDFFVYLNEKDLFFIRSDGNWQGIWIGSGWTDRNAIQQLTDLSGYTLEGSRFMNNQTLEYAEAVMSPDSLGSWSEYLDWVSSGSFGLE